MLEGIVIGALGVIMIVLVLGMYGFYKWVGRPRGAEELIDPQEFSQHIDAMKKAVERLEGEKTEAKKELISQGSPIPDSLLDAKEPTHV